MAQTKVTRYYDTRKRKLDLKLFNSKQKTQNVLENEERCNLLKSTDFHIPRKSSKFFNVLYPHTSVTGDCDNESNKDVTLGSPSGLFNETKSKSKDCLIDLESSEDKNRRCKAQVAAKLSKSTTIKIENPKTSSTSKIKRKVGKRSEKKNGSFNTKGNKNIKVMFTSISSKSLETINQDKTEEEINKEKLESEIHETNSCSTDDHKRYDISLEPSSRNTENASKFICENDILDVSYQTNIPVSAVKTSKRNASEEVEDCNLVSNKYLKKRKLVAENFDDMKEPELYSKKNSSDNKQSTARESALKEILPDDKHSKFPFQALANLTEESSLPLVTKELNISKMREICTTKRLKISELNNNKFDQTRIESLYQKKTLKETAGPKQDDRDDFIESILTTNKPPPKPISPLHLTPKKLQISSTLPENSSSKTNLNEVLKGKITPEEMRAKLAKCGKLSELRECLSKIKKCSAEMKESKPHLQTFSSMEVTVEIQSPSKNSPSPSPVKIAPEKLIPAYKKYSSLAVDELPSLSLPYKYKIHAETFRCTETIVSMLHNRREVCIFDRLKHSVQNMMRRNFDKTHLGQIMAVFPLAYVLQQEKGLHTFTSKSSSSGYHLTIAPNFDYSFENLQIIEKSSNIVKNSTNQQQKNPKFMNPSCLLERKNIFHKNLLEFVIKHHEIFLSELDPPMKVPRDKLTRWHPSFQLDQVPDILPTPLPAPPDETKYRTAQDVLDHIRGKAGQRVEQALDEIASKARISHTEESNIPSSSQAKTVTTGALKGVSQALLAKIRAKEAANILREMTRKPEQSKRLEMMARLPHLIRILRTFFIAERKAAVSWDVAVQKLLESYHTSISLNDVEDHVRLMSELLPDWLFVVQVRRGTFLKIDKNKDLTVLSERIENLMKQEK